MNAFLVSYLTAAIQVTFVGLVALALHGLLARRRPDTAVLILATSCVLSILVTVVALVPLPASWALFLRDAHRPSPHSEDISPAPAAANVSHTSETIDPPTMPFLSLLTNARGMLDRVSLQSAAGDQADALPWPAFLAVAIVLVIGALVARLVGGIWSARRLVRSGCRITDRQLVCRVDDLRRALGCTSEVDLHASPAIPSAATIGWRRPVLVLNSSWRTWSDVELTAVLAHELTHVRRMDYLAGLVARVAAILHFYNPLVRRLARSMAFAQEAVADEAAARMVGGRATYLVVLSRLALRQDRAFQALPLLAFAFTSSTFLMRRIQMLQTTDGRRRSSRSLHATVFALLVVAAAAASTLRQRAHSQEDRQDDIRVANGKDAALGAFDAVRFPGDEAERHPSIDLSYLPEAKQGLVSIRPQAFFARADMQPVTAVFDAAIRRKLAEFGVGEPAAFSVAEIEQAMGSVVVEVLDPNGGPGERGRLTVGLSAVRSDKRLPVKEVLEATHSGTTVTKDGSATIIETPEAAIPAFGPMRHFAMPDDHTVLPGVSGQALTQLTERPASEQIAAKPWFELWQAVEQHMLAIVLDNSSGDWNGPWDDTDLPEAKTLATHTKFFALGCDLQGDKLNVVLIVECAESHKTDQVVQSLQGLLAWSIREAEKANANQTHDADFLRRLYISVLKELETSKPEADAARVSLKVSVDAESSAIAALAANLASHLPTSTPSATASK